MYDLKESWRGDLYGGLNIAIVALPLAMAFGVESGLAASAGLAGAITVVSSLVIARSFEQSPGTETALATQISRTNPAPKLRKANIKKDFELNKLKTGSINFLQKSMGVDGHFVVITPEP